MQRPERFKGGFTHSDLKLRWQTASCCADCASAGLGLSHAENTNRSTRPNAWSGTAAAPSRPDCPLVFGQPGRQRDGGSAWLHVAKDTGLHETFQLPQLSLLQSPGIETLRHLRPTELLRLLRYFPDLIVLGRLYSLPQPSDVHNPQWACFC